MVYDLMELEANKNQTVSENAVELNGYRSEADGAAVLVQKSYRSYRIRRQLADSAVIAQELWWQALEYATLNHSTTSFYNISKHETSISRWNRVSLNASRVGRGLSRDSKANLLFFRHWIEAIDPRHRYGHSLHFYYDAWKKSKSDQPFFYWLDVGDGKEVDLEDCPRSKLKQQCIKYLGPLERENYEYIIAEGKIKHKLTEYLLDTINTFESQVMHHSNGDNRDTNRGEEVKCIFVMSTSKKLYAGLKKKGKFQHSSFLAGGSTLAAGRFAVEHGVLKSISPHSGHYRPSKEHFHSFLQFLQGEGVNLDAVEIDRKDKDDREYVDSDSNSNFVEAPPDSEHPQSDLFINDMDNIQLDPTTTSTKPTEKQSYHKSTLSGGLKIPRLEGLESAILQRINAKKLVDSHELGHQLSMKWSSGTGPRIGCIADYPAELRLQALVLGKLFS